MKNLDQAARKEMARSLDNVIEYADQAAKQALDIRNSALKAKAALEGANPANMPSLFVSDLERSVRDCGRNAHRYETLGMLFAVAANEAAKVEAIVEDVAREMGLD